MTVYQVEWRHYRRLFRQPLQTHHGSWSVREGILVCLRDDQQQVGWGEIAPISWFGSETIDQAIEYCRSLAGQITAAQISEIPDSLPACQFALESALETLQSGDRVGTIDASVESSLSYSVLLSLDAQNGGFKGHQSRELSENPSKTFKCKIGVFEIDREMSQIDRLLQILPVHSKLRLDANGGLSESEAYRWLEWCDRRSQKTSPIKPQIELLEQPLPPDRFLQMQQLSQQFQTPIALDESVATLQQLRDCYERGWRSIVVIKPAIAGFPSRLRQFCQAVQPDVVWSSALETAIGQRYIEHCLIPSTSLTQRAIGFGVDHWFADDWGQQSAEFLWRNLARNSAEVSL